MSLSQAPLILIVDDEVSLRFLLQNRLKKMGYEVEFADCGEKALLQIQNGLRPQMILTDLQMPGLDGLGLMGKLKDEGYDIPFILMTGFLSPETEQQARRLGALEVFTKPFSYRQLISVINPHLKTEHAPKTSEKSG